jgi:predicted nucleic-acid-binding protein
LIGIDTNVLVRYLTADDPVQSPKARHFIQRELSASEPGHVSLVALTELAWVLNSRYSASPGDISDALTGVLADERFRVQDSAAAWAALSLYRSSNVDFADALIAAVDRLHAARYTVTFDKRAARNTGMTLLG